jgi:drug/metabolite transporter (DMT)-like permease
MPLQLDLALLVVFAASIHAVWNAVVKASDDRHLTFAAILSAGTLVCLPAAFFVEPPPAAAWPYLAASVVVHNAYFVLLTLAYRFGDLGQVYPLARGTAPLAVAILAALLAGEMPGTTGAAGILLVSAGIASLAFAGGGGVSLKPVLLATATGLLIAGYNVADGLGMRQAASPWGYIVWLNMMVGLPFVLGVAAWRRHRLGSFVKARWKTDFSLGFLNIVAYVLFLYALSQGAMAHVTALRETSVLMAVLIGAVKLREPFGGSRIAAACAIVAGLIIMQTSSWE